MDALAGLRADDSHLFRLRPLRKSNAAPGQESNFFHALDRSARCFEAGRLIDVLVENEDWALLFPANPLLVPAHRP
jgi:hypothetical protein